MSIDGAMYDCLKDIFSNTREADWFTRHDNLLTAAEILNDEYMFDEPKDVIRFFEKPWKWENDLRDMMAEYENELQHMNEDEGER